MGGRKKLTLQGQVRSDGAFAIAVAAYYPERLRHTPKTSEVWTVPQFEMGHRPWAGDVYQAGVLLRRHLLESGLCWNGAPAAINAARATGHVACGTGLHLEHLRKDYEVEGLDISEEMLTVARDRLPGVPLHVADMADLGTCFDAITCLASSISHMLSEDL